MAPRRRMDMRAEDEPECEYDSPFVQISLLYLRDYQLGCLGLDQFKDVFELWTYFDLVVIFLYFGQLRLPLYCFGLVQVFYLDIGLTSK